MCDINVEILTGIDAALLWKRFEFESSLITLEIDFLFFGTNMCTVYGIYVCVPVCFVIEFS